MDIVVQFVRDDKLSTYQLRIVPDSLRVIMEKFLLGAKRCRWTSFGKDSWLGACKSGSFTSLSHFARIEDNWLFSRCYIDWFAVHPSIVLFFSEERGR